MRVVHRQGGVPATFTGFEFSTDSEGRKPPLHVYTGCMLIYCHITYTDGRTSLAFRRVEADYLKNGFVWNAHLFLVASYLLPY